MLFFRKILLSFLIFSLFLNNSVFAIPPTRVDGVDQEKLIANNNIVDGESLHVINLDDIGSYSAYDVEENSGPNLSRYEGVASIIIPIFILALLFASILMQDRFSEKCCDNDGNYSDSGDWSCDLPHTKGKDFIRFWCPND